MVVAKVFNHYSKSLASRTHLNPDTQGEAIHVNMELSTTTRGKAKLLWNGYTKHTEKNDTIRWRCTCRASKHCPASAFTDLLPAYPVVKTEHNHCPEPVKLEVDSSRMEMHIHAAASNDLPARIYADNITALTGAAKAILPSVDMCKFF